MQIDWPRYVKTAKEQGLTGLEVVRLIQKETNRKVNISEVKRRLAGTESSTLGFEADTVDVIDLIEEGCANMDIVDLCMLAFRLFISQKSTLSDRQHVCIGAMSIVQIYFGQ